MDSSNTHNMDEGAPSQIDFSSLWIKNLPCGGNVSASDYESFQRLLGALETHEFSPVFFSGLENLSENQQEIYVDSNGSEEFVNIFQNQEEIKIENSVSSVSSTLASVPASLPARENWPGQYGFNVRFNTQDKKTKGVTWTYNDVRQKLYVSRLAPCPINFFTESVVPNGVQIRAMALYSSPEHASEVVKRCMDHSGKDENLLEADHLVRCESPMANYEVDPTTGGYSVSIPFENPPPGQNFSTYIFKFSCFSSCQGSNRRPLMIVFSLMKDNQVIGRQKLDFKVCACPGRDSKSEEGQSTSTRKRKRKTVEPEVSKSLIPLTAGPSTPSKRAKGTPDQDGCYTITVSDPNCYEFLEQMKSYFQMMKIINNMPPDVKKYLEQYCQRKGYPMPQI